MDAEVGTQISFDKVMLWSDGQKIEVGTPYIEGRTVTAEIVKHGKDDKVVIFKKKRRKNYRRTRGHRQQFTEVRIKTIGSR
jgi:large subunit ribosomal protein L21